MEIEDMAKQTRTPDAMCVCGNPDTPGVHRSNAPCYQQDLPVVDMVNHPPHYSRGPLVNSLGKAERFIECIEIIRWIKDMRLATAMKYIWRVAFGGKEGVDPREDIKKAIWYLNDWLEHKV